MISKYISSRNVDIWLPDDYNTKNEYSVLYMHDGQMLFDSTTTWNNQEWGVDEVMGRLMEENKIAKCIVVRITLKMPGGKEYIFLLPFFLEKNREKIGS
jgi:predicted alpha/beta superfamily hydrolase